MRSPSTRSSPRSRLRSASARSSPSSRAAVRRVWRTPARFVTLRAVDRGGPMALKLSLLVSAALVVSLNAGAATFVAEAPPGAVISDSLEYVARVPDSAQIVEGKFDSVENRQILVTTGRFGFKTYDVSNPESPRLLDTFLPADILGPS